VYSLWVFKWIVLTDYSLNNLSSYKKLLKQRMYKERGYMRKIFIFTILLSFFAFYAYGAETKIGYVDLNKALNESQQGKEAIKVLEEMVKSKQAVLDKKGEEIKKLEEEMEKQSSIMTPESIKETQGEHEKMLREYQRMVQDNQAEIQKKQNEFMQKIISDLRNFIINIGEAENYTAIFEIVEGGILYMPKTSDITDKVILKFNETQKSAETKK